MAAEFKRRRNPAPGLEPAVAVANAGPKRKQSAQALGEAAMRRAAVRRARRRGPFKIADAYLFAQVAAATLRSLLWFAGLLIIAGALTAVRRFANGELSALGMAQVLMYQLPRVFVFTLPMSTLFGTVSTFTEMSGRGEITALGAGGWNLKRLLRAPLLWGAILSVVAFMTQEALVPAAETRKAEIMKEQGILMVAGSGAVSLRDPAKGPLKSVVQADHFDPKTNVLIHPSITIYKGLTVSMIVTAEKGFWDQNANKWKFSNGTIQTFPKGKADGADYMKSEFDEIYQADTPPPGRFSAAGKSLTENLESGNFEMVSIRDLYAWRTSLEEERADTPQEYGASRDDLIRGATFGIHDKIATPLVCLVLILVGAPLGIRPQRASGGFSVGISLIVIMAYYVTWTWASQLGKAGKVPPIPAAYMAVALTFIVGVVLVAKKSR